MPLKAVLERARNRLSVAELKAMLREQHAALQEKPVLTLSGDKICAITRFEKGVPPWFGLSRTLP
jgi:hypothetical protein